MRCLRNMSGRRQGRVPPADEHTGLLSALRRDSASSQHQRDSHDVQQRLLSSSSDRRAALDALGAAAAAITSDRPRPSVLY
jgi:hypothetical protein